jgi:hypothetical protein
MSTIGYNFYIFNMDEYIICQLLRICAFVITKELGGTIGIV